MSENPNREQPIEASPEADMPPEPAGDAAAPTDAEADLVPTDAEADLVPTDAEAAAPEEETPPDEPKIFGLPVVIFHCMALGFAGGLILSGVLQLTRNYLLIMICVGIGWFIGKQLHKRRDQNK